MNELYVDKLFYDIQCPRCIKKIKVTSDFYQYLESKCQSEILFEKADVATANFTGIPIVIDDDIYSDYYELVF